MRFALGLEYDGGPFHGWQSQAGGATVQDALEASLATIAGGPVRTHAAGRTDAGVHALAQVAHFDTDADRPISAWVRGVNQHLPQAVSVLWAQPVPDDFHARFSAIGRRYRYLLLNRASRPALTAHRAGWFARPLDVERMAAAAAVLPGEHDFSAFRAAECQAKSPVKVMHSVAIARRGDVVQFDFHASAFLQHMVRNLVGALVDVGCGRHDEGWLAELLQCRDRTRASPTFSAAGLYLSGIDYDSAWGLPVVARPEWGTGW